MAWPEATDYNEAIQNPAVCFTDPDLRQGQPEVNAMGWPLPCSGNFAAVYKVFGPDGTAWAVKCFTRQVPGLRERYHAISAHLAQAKLPFAVDFQYLEEGIRIRGAWYAVVKMRWVEGFTLNDFLKDHLDKPQLLDKLAHMWLKLARELRRAHVAHADLQHGNVLLVPGGKTGVLSVRLIDYDGMHVPALAQQKSGELGHANYQHPERARRGVYDAEVDRFPHLVIYTALHALLAGGRPLWDRHDNGENLLFREQDFKDPGKSALLRELWQMPDPSVRALVGRLALAAQAPIESVPLLAELTDGERPPALTAEQEKSARALLGEPGVSVRKPRTAAVVGKPTATAAAAAPPPVPASNPDIIPFVDEPTPAPVTVVPVVVQPIRVEPVALRRPIQRAPEASPSGLDPKLLLWAGGGAAALLLVVGIILVVLLSGPGSAETPPDPFAFPAAGEGGEGGAKRPPLPDPGKDKPAALPRLAKIPDVILLPGETQTVEVSVERRDYPGRLDLLVRAVTGAGVQVPPGAVGPRAGVPVAPRDPQAQVRVDEKIVLVAGQSKAPLRVIAGARVPDGAYVFEVEALPDLPKKDGGFGDGPPGGGRPGAPGAGNDLVQRFTVTVRKPPRSNPSVLPVGNVVKGETRDMQIDVVRAPLFALEYNEVTGTVLVGPPHGSPPFADPVPIEVVHPGRLVVVSTTFPYREQVELCRKALLVATTDELLADRAMAPRFLGLNVRRYVVEKDGSKSPPQDLYTVDPETGRVRVHLLMQRLLNDAAYADEQTDALSEYLLPGLATPLPMLAAGSYPRLQLAGIASREVEDERGGATGGGAEMKQPFGPGGMAPEKLPRGPGKGFQAQPGMANPGAGNRELRRVPLDRLPQGLRDRLAGKGFAFDPYGRAAGDPGAEGPGKGPSAPAPPRGFGRPNEGPVPPGQAGAERLPEKCVVRFFDADVQAEKTYQYSIQVCLANPNHGKEKDVRNAEDARVRQLLSPPVLTPPVAVGPDWQFHAVDQHGVVSRVKGVYLKTKGIDVTPRTPELVPVQIHTWVSAAGRPGFPGGGGEWDIAERLLLQRGELIGRAGVTVQAVLWNPAEGAFEFSGPFVRGAGNIRVIQVDFRRQGPEPLLVDFVTAKRTGGSATIKKSPTEEGPTELLFLDADGELKVRNSRDDSDPEHPEGRERLRRYDNWRQRLDAALQRAFGNPGGQGAPPQRFPAAQWYLLRPSNFTFRR